MFYSDNILTIRFHSRFESSIMNATNATTPISNIPGDDIELAFASFFYIALAIAIVFGNTLVITSFIIERRLRTTTNKFLVGLAVSDLLVGLVSVPIWVYFTIAQLNGTLVATNIHLAIFFSTMDVFSSCASVLQLTAIGVERYFAITQPINHRACSRRIYNSTAFLIWFCSLAIAGIYPAQINSTWQNEYTLIVFITCFALPSGIILFVYVKILRAARVTTRKRVFPDRKTEGKMRIQKERKIAATIAFITLLFVFAWLPFYVVTMIASFCSMKCFPYSLMGINRLVRFVKWMHFSNSAVNPLVYAYRNVEMRRTFMRILKSADFCECAGLDNRGSHKLRSRLKNVKGFICCQDDCRKQ